MLELIIFLVVTEILSHIYIGKPYVSYKSKAEVEYLKKEQDEMRKHGYNPKKLEDVQEYYEQKRAGYFKMLDK